MIFSWLTKYIAYPLWAWKNQSKSLKYLSLFEKSQYWPEDRLKEWQLDRLKKLLIHAYETVPFYRERFRKAEFDPYSFKDFSKLEQIPVLTKKEIQLNREKLISSAFKRRELIEDMTGGSTGAPVHYFYDPLRRDLKFSSTVRHNRWAGYDLGTPVGVIWGHREDLAKSNRVKLKDHLRNELLERAYYLDTSSISVEKMEEFVRLLKKKKIKVLLAYANSMFLFGKYVEEYHKDELELESIITSAELLVPEVREKIQNVFHAPVYDRYGSREFSVIASECEAFSGKHINAEVLYLEFIGQNSRKNKPGKIIVTDLFNFGMPFIRYEIGDMGVSLAPKKCECGRTLPLMDIVGGRTTDFLQTPEGKYVSGASLTIYLIARIPGVAQAQIIQEDLKHIVFKIVKSAEFNSETIHLIKQEAKRFLGDQVQIDFDFVEEIPKTNSGKYQFSISKLEISF